ncbi:hypothetical protein RSAG8_12486, partial [Rhizoctonia solani AG-8 WAC10335]
MRSRSARSPTQQKKQQFLYTALEWKPPSHDDWFLTRRRRLFSYTVKSNAVPGDENTASQQRLSDICTECPRSP